MKDKEKKCCHQDSENRKCCHHDDEENKKCCHADGENKKHCHHEECDCEEHEHCCCDDECDCEEDCKCHCEDEHVCECEDEECSCHSHGDEAAQYLAMAQRLQADFDNYRKRVAEQLDYQRQEGVRSVIEAFLPCLDTFKEAKKNITDDNVLSGINMIESKIVDTLKKLKVEKIESVGQKFDHNLHEVIAVFNDESKDEDIILDEFQAGYTLNGKVIRYAKVIVNKKQN